MSIASEDGSIPLVEYKVMKNGKGDESDILQVPSKFSFSTFLVARSYLLFVV